MSSIDLFNAQYAVYERVTMIKSRYLKGEREFVLNYPEAYTDMLVFMDRFIGKERMMIVTDYTGSFRIPDERFWCPRNPQTFRDATTYQAMSGWNFDYLVMEYDFFILFPFLIEKFLTDEVIKLVNRLKAMTEIWERTIRIKLTRETRESYTAW